MMTRALLLLGLLAAAAPLLGFGGLMVGFLAPLLDAAPIGSEVSGAVLASIGLTFLATGLAAPIGVGTALYLEEYSEEDRLTTLLESNITFLSGIPAVLYGLIGAMVLVRGLHLQGTPGLLALLLALVMLPSITTHTRDALRTVPASLREGALALGATRLRVLTAIILPAALPALLSGLLRAVARILGEAAPLLLVLPLLAAGGRALPLPVLLVAQAEPGAPGGIIAAAGLSLLGGVLLLHALAWGIDRSAPDAVAP